MTDRRQYAALQKAVVQEPEPMPIGEFGGAPSLPGEGGLVLSAPMYWFYEMSHAALNPARAFADATRLFFKNPINPFANTMWGKSIAAAAELFERSTRRYGRPEWGITSTVVGGERVPIHITEMWERPFCRLLRFERAFEHIPRRPQPKLLIVAPMSGHYATLLRGTVEAFLPNHDVYITDWADARTVPLTEGRFDLDDYIDYVISILHFLGGDTHVIAVCQPSVPVLAAAAVMEANDDPYFPRSMILMGGPIDTRVNPTGVNKLAEARGSDWFRSNVITKVPFPHPGFMRDVYPGFLQLHGFMSMNLDRHIEAHRNLFKHLVGGDGDSAQKHREFYDEYLAVMDLPAEYYLQTVDTVFVRHALPKGDMTHRGRPIDPSKIKRVALLTVEGEHDDISGVGQTEAAHALCVNIPDSRKAHWLQPTVGHYVFNGSRFRAEIAPRIADFVLSNEAPSHIRRTEPAPSPSQRSVESSSDVHGKANGSASSAKNGRAPHKGEAKSPQRPTHGPGRA
jgi:poly(3-hydroxybutyrate) depolymerase